jgi:hypothetical protein
MEPTSSAASDQPGLPPVQPPSGRHIVQMFVVPGLIVGVVVVLFLGCSGFWGWLFGLSSTPQQDLTRLESPNADIRWRAANNLAQILKRDNELACDPVFSLKLVQLLGQELDRLDELEKRLLAQVTYHIPGFGPVAIRTASDSERLKRELAELRTRRETVRYLSACLGTLSVPAGAPLLIRMARKDQGFDEKTTVLLRRHAVWMLANLGENLKRLPADKRQAVRDRFVYYLAADDVNGRQARELVIAYLDPTEPGELGVIPALAACARSDDIFLREIVALALSIWSGSAGENRLAEQTLIALTQDSGAGRRIEIGEND